MKPKQKVVLYFVGSHSTGKTSTADLVIQRLKKAGYETDAFEEVARKALSMGYKINKEIDVMTQSFITFSQIGRLIQSNSDIIIPSGNLIRSMTYAILARLPDWFLDTLETFLFHVKNHLAGKGYKQFWFYTPIETKVEKDGDRSEDESFRSAIDKEISRLLETYSVSYSRLEGDIETKASKVIEILKLNGVID